MTIAPLKKITLVGLAADKDKLVKDLQSLGAVHLIPLRTPEQEEVLEGALDVLEAKKALSYLSDCPIPRRPVKKDRSFDAHDCVAQTLAIKQQLEDLEDQKRFLVKRISDVEPWGDIHFPPLEALRGERLWFYRLPLSARPSLADVALPWSIVQQDSRYLYVAVVSRDEPAVDAMPIARTHVGARSLTQLHHDLEKVELDIEELDARRVGMTRYALLLGNSIAAVEDKAERLSVGLRLLEDGHVVGLQGWAPEDRADDVKTLARDLGLALRIEAPSKDDKIPTLIEHEGLMKAGAALANFYSVPPYGSVDPSAAILFSFTLFFGLIVADLGYGLLMLIGLGFFWRKLGASEGGRVARQVMVLLSGTTMAVGLLVGSLFGVAPEAGSLRASVQLFDLQNFDQMMALSIFIGLAHLMLANAMRAAAAPNLSRASEPIAWMAMFAGGAVLWQGWSNPVAFGLMASAALIILLFAGETKPTGLRTTAIRAVEGVKGLLGMMSAFGDALSYMRLFALALAGASLAATFNTLAADVRDAYPGLGLLAALLILLIGHGLNLTLALMSGVVHGLRLNFIEFYNWSLSGSGERFRAIRKREIKTWTPS